MMFVCILFWLEDVRLWKLLLQVCHHFSGLGINQQAVHCPYTTTMSQCCWRSFLNIRVNTECQHKVVIHVSNLFILNCIETKCILSIVGAPVLQELHSTTTDLHIWRGDATGLHINRGIKVRGQFAKMLNYSWKQKLWVLGEKMSSTICNVCHCEVHDDGAMSGLQLQPVTDAADDAAMLWHLHHTEVQHVWRNIEIHGLENCCIQRLHFSLRHLVTRQQQWERYASFILHLSAVQILHILLLTVMFWVTNSGTSSLVGVITM